MSETPFSTAALVAMTDAEARVRGQLAGSSLLRSAERTLDTLRSERAAVTIGRLDVLHGAILDRFASAAGRWTVVHATDVFATLLVHGTDDASAGVRARFDDIADVRLSVLDDAEARARLRSAGRVALLPIEVAIGTTRTQLRVFAFPDAVRPKRSSMSAALADAIDTDVVLVRGLTWLRVRDLRAVEAGDAITIDHMTEDGLLFGFVAGATHALALSADTRGVRYEGRTARPRPPNVRLENSMTNDEIALDAIEDVEVEVTLDVGSVRLSLRDLATLEPGAVLLPDVGATDRVTLRANGRAIGRGTLVRVEGTLAVRIDALAGGASETSQ